MPFHCDDLVLLDESPSLKLYRATHEQLGNVLLRCPSAADETGSMAGFEREVSLAGDLAQDWAVQPIGIRNFRGQKVLVLRDEGSPLSSSGPAPRKWGKVLDLAIAAAEAMVRMHAIGLVHRDIRPFNILVDDAGRTRFTGFASTVRTRQERLSGAWASSAAGTPRYMSPEQTGRMNRSVDSRSDLYSLGISLYELFTGGLPFLARDTLDWFHCHIARQPVPPSERNGEIPPQIDQIILHLLEKNAEDRYQTARGLASDLQKCRELLRLTGNIQWFTLGTDDVPEKLQIPELLYGREYEIGGLVSAYDHVARSGASEVYLISGTSGTGKSSIVQELQKTILATRGFVIAGKFDQFRHKIPYATLASALNDLAGQIEGRREDVRADHINAVREVFEADGPVGEDFFPDLLALTKPVQTGREFSPQEARGKLFSLVRGLLTAVARENHPLVLFLDDMQWLDSPTLDLFTRLATDASIRHVLFVGAYRDDEMGPDHQLGSSIETIRSRGTKITNVRLGHLTMSQVSELVSDSLRQPLEVVRDLADAVYKRTEGNPYFATQFLGTLEEDGHLTYRGDGWAWDLEAIRSARVNESLATLIIGRLGRLSESTREAIFQLACLGHSVSAAIQEALALPAGELEVLISQGFISRVSDELRFTHDRVQEAAYALTPADQRSERHLEIGFKLFEGMNSARAAREIFTVAGQLNMGAGKVRRARDRVRIAALSVEAGKKAKTGGAYDGAVEYFEAASRILHECKSDGAGELRFESEYHVADCYFMDGRVDEAESSFNDLMSRSKTAAEMSLVAGRLVVLYTHAGRIERATDLCLGALRARGVELPPDPTMNDVMSEYRTFMHRLGDRKPADLAALPRMTDPHTLLVMGLLEAMQGPAGIISSHLREVVTLRMMNLSLLHGNSGGSAAAYVHITLLVGSELKQRELAYEFGSLAVDLVEKHHMDALAGRVYAVFAGLIAPWVRPLGESYALAVKATDAGSAGGDLTWVSYSWWTRVVSLLDAGVSLDKVEEEANLAVRFVTRARFFLALELVIVPLRFVRALKGATDRLDTFNEPDFQEIEYEKRLEAPNLVHAARKYWMRKIQLFVIAGKFQDAYRAIKKAQLEKTEVEYSMEDADYQFYGSLARSGMHDQLSDAERAQNLADIRTSLIRLDQWAACCPANFEGRAALLRAELARLEGKLIEAEQSYDTAISSVRREGALHVEALCHERVASFYQARALPTAAALFRSAARECYRRWGATAKVHLMDRGGTAGQARAERELVAQSDETLDLTSVMQVSQTLSSEMNLDVLIERMMQSMLQNAGAARGLLLLQDGPGLRIVAGAETRPNGVQVQSFENETGRADLPESLCQYVYRTGESVLLDDARSPNSFSLDPYFVNARPRSVLCIPLSKQGAQVGVLYLENNFAPYAFTASRSSALQIIASQAAISIENARLYRDLQHTREQAQAAEAETRLTFNMIPALAWSMEADGSFLTANEQWHRFTRLSVDQARRGWMHAFHRDDIVLVSAKIDEMVRDCKPVEIEARMADSSGEDRYYLVRFRPQVSENGELIKCYCTSTDIDDSRWAEQLVNAENSLLEMLHAGENLSGIASRACRILQSVIPGAGCALLACNPAEATSAGTGLPLQLVSEAERALAVYVQSGIETRDDVDVRRLESTIKRLGRPHGLTNCVLTWVSDSTGEAIGVMLMLRSGANFTNRQAAALHKIADVAGVIFERRRVENRLKASLAEKEALLKEVHHRVKNNLQLISSLLNLQGNQIADAETAKLFLRSRDRIRSMALVHENLYRAGNFAGVSMGTHIRTLCDHVLAAHSIDGRRISLTCQLEDVDLDLDRAVSVGLVVNELVSNALKHAFITSLGGEIEVKFGKLSKNALFLKVKDNGRGISKEISQEENRSFGFQLVTDLAEQLRGHIKKTSTISGTAVSLIFPL